MDEITVQNLTALMKMQEVIVLDVRPSEVFARWHLENQNAHLINIPLQQLSFRMQELPKEKTIYTLCNRGNTSTIASDLLQKQGFNAASIAGGMKAWSEQFEVKELKSDALIIYQCQRIGKGCLSYVLISNGNAVVIDPSIHLDTYRRLADQNRASIVGVIDTHRHADHISGAGTLAEQENIPYYAPEEDFKEAKFSFIPLHEGVELIFGTVYIMPIKTAGHTFGMTCLIANEKYVFTGDSIFIESVGRPDLAGKSEELAKLEFDSLQMMLQKFPKEAMIFPAHFGNKTEKNSEGFVASTLKELAEKNPYLQIQEKKSFVEKITLNLPTQPKNFAEIREINLEKNKPDREEMREIEFGPNNCASSR